MALNQLKTGALLSYVSLGLSNLLGLLYTPFMLRMLGQSEYGLYSLVSSVIIYLSILDFGFGSAIIRYTAQFRSLEKKKEQYELFGMFFILYTGIGIIAFTAGLGLYFNLDRLFGATMTPVEISKARIMMMLMIFNVAVTFPLSIFGSIIIAHEKFIFQRLLSITRSILYPCIMVPLLLLGYKAIGMVVVIITLNILSLIINFLYCKTKLKIKLIFTKFNWHLLKEISTYSFYIFLAIIVDRVFWSSGQLILGVIAGTSVVAIYAIAIQLNSFYINFSTAISSVFLPKVTSMITQNIPEEEISNLFIRVGRIQYVIMAFILSCFILFGKSFIIIWAGVDYTNSYLITLIIMVPLTFPLIQNLGVTILQAKNQLKFRSILLLIVALLGFSLSIPLAKKYGGIGCAMGTSLALIAGNIISINIYYYKRIHINIPQFWMEIFKMSFPISIVFVLGILLNYIHPQDRILSLGIKIILFTLFYIILLWWKGLNQFERNLFGNPIKRILLRAREISKNNFDKNIRK